MNTSVTIVALAPSIQPQGASSIGEPLSQGAHSSTTTGAMGQLVSATTAQQQQQSDVVVAEESVLAAEGSDMPVADHEDEKMQEEVGDREEQHDAQGGDQHQQADQRRKCGAPPTAEDVKKYGLFAWFEPLNEAAHASMKRKRVEDNMAIFMEDGDEDEDEDSDDDSSSSQGSTCSETIVRSTGRSHKRLRPYSSLPGIQASDSKVTLTQWEKKGKQVVVYDHENSKRTERMLDAMQEELTCNLCAGTFIDAVILSPCGHAFCGSCVKSYLDTFKINTSLNYSNPTPIITSTIRFARMGYGDDAAASMAAAANATANGGAPAGEAATAAAGPSSGIPNNAAPVGFQATPDDGIACPQCRHKPTLGAFPSHVLANLVETLLKERPEAVRPQSEMTQAQAIWKKGDLFSFPQPAVIVGGTGMNAGAAADAVAAGANIRRTARQPAVEYYKPCPNCKPAGQGEEPDRYVCPVPVPDPNNPELRMPASGMLPDGHLLCGNCEKIYAEALAVSCVACGESMCGKRERCTIPKLSEYVKMHESESPLEELDYLESHLSINYLDSVTWLGVFGYNYVELAYFLAYVGKQHHRIFDAPRQGPATEQRISTEKIIRNIGEWLETEEGINAGGIKGIFERADKEILPLTAGNPVRLCNGCGEDILRAGLFEWWIRETAKPNIREHIPDAIKNREDCKRGRNCPYQQNIEHSKTYDQMHTKAHQVTPEPADNGNVSDTVLLRNALTEAKTLYGLNEDGTASVRVSLGENGFVLSADPEDSDMDENESIASEGFGAPSQGDGRPIVLENPPSIASTPGVATASVDTTTPAVSRGVQTEMSNQVQPQSQSTTNSSGTTSAAVNTAFEVSVVIPSFEPLPPAPGSRFQSPFSPVNGNHESAIMT